jgi:hypothetical protein
MTIPRVALLGALAGAGWGVLARVWMRLLASEPHFTWSGTLLILAFSALLGAGAGVVAGARRAGRSLWWSLAVVPGLILFLGPGMLLAPSFLLGGLAFARRGRVAAALGWGVLALSLAGSTAVVATHPDPGEEATVAIVLVFIVGYAVLSVLLAAGGSHLWRRRTVGTAVPRARRGRPRAPRSPVAAASSPR